MKTLQLRVPSPPDPPRLDAFLARNVPELSRRAVKRLIDGGSVRLGGRVERHAGTELRAGQEVELSWRPSTTGAARVEKLNTHAILWAGDGCWAVDKPAGVPSHRTHGADPPALPELLADLLGREGSAAAPGLRPAHRLDRGTSGVLLVCEDDASLRRFSQAFQERGIGKEYRAVVEPGPSAQLGASGELDGPSDAEGRPMHLRWELLRRGQDGRRAELAVWPEEGRTHQVRIQLAAAGMPIVGDLEHGAARPGGAARMALHCRRMDWDGGLAEAPMPPGWDALLEGPGTAPTNSKKSNTHADSRSRGGLPTARARSAASRARLRVSAASARILRAGHPWVLRDRDTGDLSLLAPGVTADLVAPDGSFVARAMIDPGRPLCARVLAWEPDEPLDQAAMTRRAAAALERRASLLGDPETDAIRLIHGEADGLPGLFVDRWADLLVATRASVAVAAWSSGVYDLLRGRFPGAALWERDHFDDLQARDPGPDAARLPGRWAFGGITPSGSGPREVHERGLRFLVDPLHGLSSGLYPDQRENRDRLAALLRASPGGAVANLFAHTGAFSVACAAAGADCVLSVDLSPRFCDQAQDNLRRNGLDPERHPVLVADAAAWLREDKRPLRGLIVDPPAHARARSGRRGGWSTKDDLVPLLATAFGRLEPGGFLLCCVNWKGLKKGAIEDSVRAAARSAGRRLSSLLAAPPAADFPRLRGFPEGTAFWGVLATVGAPA